MCLFFSVFEPRRRLQRCVKNVRWWAMAMGGSGHLEMVGIPNHLDPRSGDQCHQPILPLPSMAGEQVEERAIELFSQVDAALYPAGSHHLAAVGEQSRLEYPERMATIRPGKVIEVLPWEWWQRFGWCYQVAEGWRLSRGANQQGSRVPSSHMILSDCPCFPRKQSKQPERVPMIRRGERNKSRLASQFAFWQGGEGLAAANWKNNADS